MTTCCFSRFLAIALAFTVVTTTAFPAVAPGTQTASVAQDTKGMTASATSARPVGVAAAGEAVSASWEDIKDCTFEKRTEFATGLRRLEDRLEVQIGELTDNRAHMRNDSHDWDFAMIEMTAARSDLKSMADDAVNGTSDAWKASKDKIAKVWLGSQKAYQTAQRIVRS